MFYRGRLNDDYEVHQRNHGFLKDDLDVLVANMRVMRQSWYKGVLARIGDFLILVGNSMNERADEFACITLSSLTRRRNETIFE
jgi:hypothetical protein